MHTNFYPILVNIHCSKIVGNSCFILKNICGLFTFLVLTVTYINPTWMAIKEVYVKGTTVFFVAFLMHSCSEVCIIFMSIGLVGNRKITYLNLIYYILTVMLFFFYKS